MAPHVKFSAFFPSSLSDFRTSKRFNSNPNAPSSAAAKNRSACASRLIFSGSNEASSAVADLSSAFGGRGRKGASGTRGRTKMSVGTGVGMVILDGTRVTRRSEASSFRDFTPASNPAMGRAPSVRPVVPRAWFPARAASPCARAPTPRVRLHTGSARSRPARAPSRARRCDGRQTQIRPLWCVSPVRPRPV